MKSPSNAAVVDTLPIFGTIEKWCSLTGMGRRATYDALGHGHLIAVKVGTRTLINIAKGLVWLEAQPTAQIRPQRRREPANS
ncbi:hypothetical protein [Acidocella sp.]|uniref:hypothetical protein n=1 Tax=Acidocella sp. TaxID=50710 RepID=UPI00260C3380|nr:hypothetical protein [Acidocella sp.]